MGLMWDKRSTRAVHKYLDGASPEERREFAETLLNAQSRVRRDSSVPRSLVRASRLASVALVGVSALDRGFEQEQFRLVLGLALLLAIAWFPNQLAQATGRFGVGRYVSRPSHPWVLLIVAWLLLLVFALAALFGGPHN